MKVIKIFNIPRPRELFINPIFTGPDVSRQVLSIDSQNIDAIIINLGKGSRNRIRPHSAEQLIFVTSGKETFAMDKEEICYSWESHSLFRKGETLA